MKEKIYTIPINEAFDKCTECAICEFEKQEELSRIEYTLGASMMEPDERIFTNEKGFCQRHTSMLLANENKLSLALVMKTHIDSLTETIDKCEKEFENSQNNSSLFRKNKDTAIDDAIDKISNRQTTCAICERLSYTMDKFLDNLLYMYDTDKDFKEKFLSSKAFCFKHYSQLLNKAKTTYKGEKLKDFCITLSKLELENFKRISDDTDWFTKKFDYRYSKEDWKNSKDAVPRICTKIGGYCEK